MHESSNDCPPRSPGCFFRWHDLPLHQPFQSVSRCPYSTATSPAPSTKVCSSTSLAQESSIGKVGKDIHPQHISRCFLCLRCNIYAYCLCSLFSNILLSQEPVKSKTDSSKADTSDQSSGDQEKARAVLGAQNLVLCQWPYFKTMFKSEFEESGTGVKTIKVKGVSLATLRPLLPLMFTGRIQTTQIQRMCAWTHQTQKN